MIIVGQGALPRSDGAVIWGSLRRATAAKAVRDDWNGFAVLHTAASRVGGLDLGFVPGEGGKNVAGMMGALDVLFLLGADELDMAKIGDAFTVYIGTHGDAGAHRADVILPGSAYTEKSGAYVNTEGRVQQTNRAGFAPGDAKDDWAIIRALSDVLGKRLPSIHWRNCAASSFGLPAFARNRRRAGGIRQAIKASRRQGHDWASAFVSAVKDFYLTNPIARASAVMAECSALARDGFKQAAE
jgi:NADH-quinone oxidoreductase subunit G